MRLLRWAGAKFRIPRLSYQRAIQIRSTHSNFHPWDPTATTSPNTKPKPKPKPNHKTKTIPLARLILSHLGHHGCTALHGVPGDFTLPFLTYLRGSQMHWVGNCNELNAAYAADGYARITGLGAVCTTYGVGELSALNGIAGSYAERVPVVHIVGTPRTGLRRFFGEGGKVGFDGLVHHALGRGRGMGVYREMASQVTADVVRLEGMEVENAIRRCMREKRPVYIDLPSDLAALEVEASELVGERDGGSRDAELVRNESEGVRPKRDLLELMTRSKRPLIMVDGVAARYGLENELNELVRASRIPTVVTTHGLGIIDSTHPNYYGVYTGSLGNPQLKEYVDNSDFVMLFGELFSDTATGGWDAVPKQSATVNFSGDEVRYTPWREDGQRKSETCSGSIKQLLTKMLQQTGTPRFKTPYAAHRSHGIVDAMAGKSFDALLPPKKALEFPVPAVSETANISQDYIWPRLSSYFRPHDTILLANGTPLIGGAMFTLPSPVRVIASGLWFSIGQMLPAAQGVALALAQSKIPLEKRGRTILLEGDGSFQTTAQELSTIIRNKLDVTIFLVNNKGYAYERLILGPEADYNAVADWDYTLAAQMMGGKSTKEYPIFSTRVGKVGELDALLRSPQMNEPRGLKLVEVAMGEKDVPSYFKPVLEKSGEKLGGNADNLGEGVGAVTSERERLCGRREREEERHLKDEEVDGNGRSKVNMSEREVAHWEEMDRREEDARLAWKKTKEEMFDKADRMEPRPGEEGGAG